ncbi:phosphate/phosphite/phosphonate ABC transporter substrate-binding protein [Carnobacterium maltaromaticum]|uniref:phosphate/phosphite/phosphonate ABC transporter substrate-binding protein n=1 Tax=Carnobacterium maltaromaticum TaxID=2751 RepID=UPI0039AF26D3
MKFVKNGFLLVFGLVLVVSLAACGSKKESGAKEESYTPKELTVQFVPTIEANTIEAKAKPLEKLLSDELGIPVKVTVSTDYNTIIEAMASKQTDVGIMPPNAYVLGHEQEAADAILQAQRFAIKQPGGETSTELADGYRAMIVVKKGSPIKNLKDLKGKKIAAQDVVSASGYVFPVAEMQKAGINVDKEIQFATVKGIDAGLMAVLDGSVDAAFSFEDGRNLLKKDLPDVFDKLDAMYFTEAKIPNDAIAARPDLSDKWKTKVQDAFVAIGKSDKGRELISSLYAHEGYVPADDSSFDIVREYAKEVGQ